MPDAMNALFRFHFIPLARAWLAGLVAFGVLGPWNGALMAATSPTLTVFPGASARNADHRHDIPVTLMREGGIGLVLPKARIRVDGREVASLSAGETVTIYVAAGRVVFGIGAWSSERKFTQTIAAGTSQRFRIGMTTDNRFFMTRVSDFSR